MWLNLKRNKKKINKRKGGINPSFLFEKFFKKVLDIFLIIVYNVYVNKK